MLPSAASVTRTLAIAVSLALSFFSLFPAGAAAETQAPDVSFPVVIDDVEIVGLWRTLPKVALRELPWKPGTSVTGEEWELGLVRLWNTGIFSRVSGRIEPRDDGRNVAVLSLEERWTILPILRFTLSGDTLWLQLGAYDLNLFGRFLDVGFRYERFGEHNGGAVWFHDPRLFNLRLDSRLTLEHLTRPRTTFAATKTAARLELLYEEHDRLRWGGNLEVWGDSFSANDQTSTLPSASRSGAATFIARAGLVSTERLRQYGWSLELRPMLGVTNAPVAPLFAQAFGEAIGFARVGQRWNLGARIQAGITSPVQPQLHYWFGGLDILRGFTDNYLQGTAFAAINAEARFIAFDSTWLALMPTVFVDAAAVNPQDGSPPAAVSAGGGIRFIVPRLVRTVVRVDVAVPLTPRENVSFVFSSAHMF